MLRKFNSAQQQLTKCTIHHYSKSNFDSFKHIAIALEEMDLRIEEIWMFDVWELFYRVLRRHNAMKQ